jgi:hypothetical protein
MLRSLSGQIKRRVKQKHLNFVILTKEESTQVAQQTGMLRPSVGQIQSKTIFTLLLPSPDRSGILLLFFFKKVKDKADSGK